MGFGREGPPAPAGPRRDVLEDILQDPLHHAGELEGRVRALEPRGARTETFSGRPDPAVRRGGAGRPMAFLFRSGPQSARADHGLRLAEAQVPGGHPGHLPVFGIMSRSGRAVLAVLAAAVLS